ncbi:16168_t:CDS:2 [Cetraspora pellucida]|uniref:16168_t:CDS:1 n=1 Tax=Cetraspora pellucida TaxID=1433469 RepID=A0ACA9MJ80_9GLOM|nr:16168_t:CDS:2 [Cetraspora pellucida]
MSIENVSPVALVSDYDSDDTLPSSDIIPQRRRKISSDEMFHLLKMIKEHEEFNGKKQQLQKIIDEHNEHEINLQKERIHHESKRDDADRRQRENEFVRNLEHREKESLRQVDENIRQIKQREKESIRQLEHNERESIRQIQHREKENSKIIIVNYGEIPFTEILNTKDIRLPTYSFILRLETYIENNENKATLSVLKDGRPFRCVQLRVFNKTTQTLLQSLTYQSNYLIRYPDEYEIYYEDDPLCSFSRIMRRNINKYSIQLYDRNNDFRYYTDPMEIEN